MSPPGGVDSVTPFAVPPHLFLTRGLSELISRRVAAVERVRTRAAWTPIADPDRRRLRSGPRPRPPLASDSWRRPSHLGTRFASKAVSRPDAPDQTRAARALPSDLGTTGQESAHIRAARSSLQNSSAVSLHAESCSAVFWHSFARFSRAAFTSPFVRTEGLQPEGFICPGGKWVSP
jgi:hypothetical protein